MDRYPFALLVLVVALWAPASARADLTLPPGFSTVTLASGLADPVGMAYAPDGRLFVAEKAGRLRVVTAGGSLLAAPVIDISDHVATKGDRGLLGVAVDTAYASNHYVYLLYTHDTDQANPAAEKTARLTRIVVLPDNTLAGPEQVLLGTDATVPCPPASNTSDCIPSSSDSHSIGTVRSDPDGTLWVGSGDGAEYNWTDVNSLRALDEQSLAGKILHVDRQGRGLPGHLFCPDATDLDLVCAKLYAKGFRNPFRFHLRPGAGPVVGDVGWGLTEEIDAVEGGKSYGWPCYEGSEQAFNYRDMPQCQAQYALPHAPPVYTYPHVDGGGAVVAGPRYTGTRYPDSYRGAWFVGDYVHGWIRAYDLVGDQPVDPGGVREFASGWSGVDLETTPQGDLAFVSFGDGSPNSGSIERISYGNAAPPAKANATPESGSAPLDVDFSADVSVDPDGDTVSYEWDFGDGTNAGGRTASHRYQTRGAYTAMLTVRDAGGLYSRDTVVVAVDDTSPVATIQAPTDGALFRHGVPVQLLGTGHDDDGDALTLTWRVVLHHGDHIHLAATDLHGAAQSFTPPGDHDADSYYEVQLSATDGFRTDTKSVDIRPEATELTLASEPPGVPLSYSGREYTAPAVLTSAIGYRTSLSAPETVTRGGVVLPFSGWSDGGERLHQIVVPATSRTLTARYGSAPAWTGGVGGPAALAPPAATRLGPPPRLRLNRPGRRARSIGGRVLGVASAPRVLVALRTAPSGGRCRSWDADRGRLGRLTRCRAGHAWMRATVTRRAGASPDWDFRARLRGAPRAGRYVVTTRVTDNRGRTLLGPTSAALRLR